MELYKKTEEIRAEKRMKEFDAAASTTTFISARVLN